MAGRLWALVLAGGDGTRLQSLTRLVAGAPIPKQYCRLLGDQSLLETTMTRIAPLVPAARTLAIVNHDHLSLARPQLAALPAENVVVQPSNRDTGPGLLLSLLALARRDPGARVAVFPSDHYFADERAFRRHVTRAARVVHRLPDRIALLGIPPEHPEPGFGYVEPGARVAFPGRGAFEVAAFHEKPVPSVAARLVAQGGLWNSFVMVFRVDRMLELLCRARPLEVARMCRALDQAGGLAALYGSLASWNLSRDFLARVPEHLVVVRAERTGWSDWGTRESIERTLRALDRTPPWWAIPAAATA